MNKGTKKTKKAVVLASGGIDSTTTLAIARSEGYEVYALTIDYGQRHHREVRMAQRAAAALGVEKHLVIPLNLRPIGGSALTSKQRVPKNRKLKTQHLDIPTTYVPARNTIFLSLALAWAESLNIYDIFIGVNAIDYSGYPDCRPQYISAFERMANLGTKAGVSGGKFHIHTPLINLTKGEIIKTGIELGVNYSLTHSCYDPDEKGRACGRCDSCLLRLKGFREAGLPDPVTYRNKM
ncbi:MAG: 7-cyano-7-deazaguanine synthase QueC [bacterium]